MNAIELKVLEVKKPEVMFNVEEIKSYLDSVLKQYDGLVFTEETVKDCKATVAELNKMSKSVDSFRLKYKKELSEPIAVFEKKCKELVEMIENAQLPLKEQADKFEIQRKAEKEEVAKTILECCLSTSGLNDEFVKMVTLKEEYKNASISKTKIRESVETDISIALSAQNEYLSKLEVISTKCELFSIKLGLNIQLSPETFLHLARTHSKEQIETFIGSAAEKQLEKEKEAIERIRIEEESKANKIAEVKVAEMQEVVNQVIEETQHFIPTEATKEEKVYTLKLELKATESQLASLKDYLNACGIEFLKIK